MDGLINFNKPTGITSANALYKVRRIIGIRKSGHAGTLDPAAEGVLLLGIGKGTKLTERLMDLPKGYRAIARLDVTSSSYDCDRPLEPLPIPQIPDRSALDAALAGMVGLVSQVPPTVSALKIGGVPAYRLERKGVAPAMKPRSVRIYACSVVRYSWPELEFDVICGRGTYIRAMIRDLGVALETGGCLTGLRRTFVGPFTAEAAVDFESLGIKPESEWLHRVEDVVRIIEAWSSEHPEFINTNRSFPPPDRTEV